MAETLLWPCCWWCSGWRPWAGPSDVWATPECCELGELEKAGVWLSEGRSQEPQSCHFISQPTHQGEEPQCQGRSHGPPNTRSIAPWRYREDCDSTRFPRRLVQAECLCPHCVSLAPPAPPGPPGQLGAGQPPAPRSITGAPVLAGPAPTSWSPSCNPVAVACVCVVPQF
ncbi:unnamed protein product [Lepidochelys kempii]